MDILNANDLKVGGVTAIEAALQASPEVAISVRGERRFVVMNMAQYEHLRECELEAAWLASQADRGAGRAKAMTASQHIADMERRLAKPASALAIQQERSAYRANTRASAAVKPKAKAKSPRRKSTQAKAQ